LNEAVMTPDKTTGNLICADGRPMTNCPITVAFYDGNGFVTAQSTITSTNGDFEVILGCANGSQSGRRFVITSSCCPGATWTIPTACCCGDVGKLICQSCPCSTPPMITCPSNLVVWTCLGPTGQNGAAVNYTIIAGSACDPTPTVTCTPASGSFFREGTNTVNCTARDRSGNISQCSFLVTVIVDTTPPRLTCSSNIVANCQHTNQTQVTYIITAVDDCDPNPIVTCNPPSGSAFPLGTTAVNCDATDKCGNKSSSCSFTVNVVDATPTLATISYSAPDGIIICWPINCRDYVIQCKANLSPTVPWTTLILTPTVAGDRYCVRVPFAPNEPRFYRLTSSTH